MFECRTRRAVDFAPAPKKATEIFSVCCFVLPAMGRPNPLLLGKN